VIEFVIQLNPETGQIQVRGPLTDRMLCYGMLAMAQEIIAKQAAEVKPGPASTLVVPTLAFPGRVK
jgi:hypothetical protein